SSGKSKLHKTLRHGAAKGCVMLVDDGEVASLTMALQSASSSQQGLVYFVAQHQQGGQRTHPVPGSLIAPRVLDLADQLLGSELLQVVGGATRCVFRLASGLNLGREGRSAKSSGQSGQSYHRLGYGSHPSLVLINYTHAGLASPSRLGQLLQGHYRNEQGVNPGSHVHILHQEVLV